MYNKCVDEQVITSSGFYVLNPPIGGFFFGLFYKFIEGFRVNKTNKEKVCGRSEALGSPIRRSFSEVSGIGLRPTSHAIEGLGGDGRLTTGTVAVPKLDAKGRRIIEEMIRLFA